MSFTATRRGIYGKLAGDTTLNNLLATPPSAYSKSIYFHEAPQNATYPFVIFSKQSGTPTQAFADPSVFDSDVWLIKGVDRNSSADPAEAIAARIVALLNDATLSISGATNLFLRRQSDVQYPEDSDGVLFQHVGCLFRLVTS